LAYETPAVGAVVVAVVERVVVEAAVGWVRATATVVVVEVAVTTGAVVVGIVVVVEVSGGLSLPLPQAAVTMSTRASQGRCW